VGETIAFLRCGNERRTPATSIACCRELIRRLAESSEIRHAAPADRGRFKIDRSMKTARKNWRWLVLGLGIFALAFVWLDANPGAQVNNSSGHTTGSVAAPGPGQKKVVLKNLGMT